MEKNDKENTKASDKETQTPYPSTQNSSKPKITEVKYTIITPAPSVTPSNQIDFIPVIDQPLPPPCLFSYPIQQLFRSRVFEIPPSNAPRHLQFYAFKGQHDFF